MDNYYDDIMIEYNNFLAEQELYDNLISLGASIYNESSGLIVIQEDYKDTINKYIDKIILGIQKAWDNFKNKVVEFAVQPIIDRIKDKIGTYKDGSVTANYWHKYDMSAFDNVKLASFDFDKMKQFENKTSYYKSAYSNVFTDENKSLKENIIDKVIDTEDEHIVSTEDINKLFEFVTNGFKNKTTALENDLKTFNGSVNTIKTAANVTTPGETTATVDQETTVNTKESMDMLIGLYESYNVLLEEGPEDNNTKHQTATNNDKSGGDNKEQRDNIKRITWYLSGNTEVVSAKMKILRQRYLDAINILKIAFPKEKEENKEEVEVKATTTNNQQIDINGTGK